MNAVSWREAGLTSASDLASRGYRQHQPAGARRAPHSQSSQWQSGQSPSGQSPSGQWRLAGLVGRLVELSGAEESAVLTFACGLVREAQMLDEPVAWLTLASQSFYPPDVAAGGVDLNALWVVRLARTAQLGRAADQLTRSGAFGLVVLDLPPRAFLRMTVLSRLLGLAQKHATTLLFLTQKEAHTPSVGSLVSLRLQAVRRAAPNDGRFACELQAIKDKRRAPGWQHKEICNGPAGLC